MTTAVLSQESAPIQEPSGETRVTTSALSGKGENYLEDWVQLPRFVRTRKEFLTVFMDQLSFDGCPTQDLYGSAATAGLVVVPLLTASRAETFGRFCRLLDRLSLPGEDRCVRLEAAANGKEAIHLLLAMDFDGRVSPDEDGDLVLAFSKNRTEFLIGLDGKHISIIRYDANGYKYFDEMIFSIDTLRDILAA